MAKKDKVEVQKGEHMGPGPNEMGVSNMPYSAQVMEDMKHHEMRRSYQYPEGFHVPKK